MLRGLEIRDMLIIDRLDLQFEPGLNTLTGETGAGKSILLDSLGFVLGWRGRAELVRQGAVQGEVTAWFELTADHPAHDILQEAGIPDEGELILRRVNTSDGRKTAWINDRRASGEVLRRLSDCLVELHGQQDDRGLLDTRNHMAFLDQFADLKDQMEQVRQLWTNVAAARKALTTVQASLADMRQEEEFLRHSAQELALLAPEPGEEARLDSRRRLMQASEKIRQDVLRASTALSRDGAEGMITDALRWLENAAVAVEGRLDPAIAALERALAELGESGQQVDTCLEDLSCDPQELEQVEERLFAIRGLARKHGVAPDNLGDLSQDMQNCLEGLESGDANLQKLQDALQEAEQVYDKAALALTKARQQGARALDQAVMQELAPLKMERACFETQVTPASDGPYGRDQVVFTVATNPGAPAGPLQKIASGGELSRFLLALKLCLSGDAQGVTMIFDEIDRGVGGATADAVGRRLERLARQGQILVVTHSPQVAARAQHHWRVEKHIKDDHTLSSVHKLSGPERVEEIARMISGDHISDEARQAAKALLQG